MDLCFFVSDLHGKVDKYEVLFNEIIKDKPDILFIGGDILPSAFKQQKHDNKIIENFIDDYIAKRFGDLKKLLGKQYPEVYLILGNDDPRIYENIFLDYEKSGLWKYIHNEKTLYKKYKIIGYSYVPPTPFMLKDWEKYDVSRYADPGCIHPTNGYRTVAASCDVEYSTIQKDLENLTKNEDVSDAIFLFHSPAYKTYLDRAALDNKMIDYVPLDVHVGSIAIKNFIEDQQPYITLHGHIHESSSITGFWQQKIKNTYSFSAAYDGKELAIIKFDIKNPALVKRILI